MGNAPSAFFEEENVDTWWQNNTLTEPEEEPHFEPEEPNVEQEEEPDMAQSQEKSKLEDWIAKIKEKRRQILNEKAREIAELRNEIRSLKNENEVLRSSNDSDLIEQTLQMGALREKVETLQREKEDYKSLVVALKNVNVVAKQMIQLRETQIKELSTKLDDIEKLIPKEKENINLKREYEKQLLNIRNLKALYEEKQLAEKREKAALVSNIETLREELEAEKAKNKEKCDRISELEDENSKKYDEIMQLESSLGLSQADCRQLEAELTIINQLFSDILVNVSSSNDMDLDRLHKYLEDHHDLLQSIANESDSGNVSAMPKALLDLISQFEDKSKNEEKDKHVDYQEAGPSSSTSVIDNFEAQVETNEVEQEQDVDNFETESSVSSSGITVIDLSEVSPSTSQQINSPEEIVKKLPKVWKVLIELLSHQMIPVNNLTDINNDSICYKTVQTPKGPNLVLSVSQTFIRLKNLIMEKKSLEKEQARLKQLNCHLEKRLQEQDTKLNLVQSEVSKTWHMVGKIQKHHQLLHTQEQVLRYELAQKRKLLTELKEELESGREKWAQAKEKNENTEKQCKVLRSEFASRKRKGVKLTTVFVDSTESGFSDEVEGSSDSNEETE